MNKRKRSIVFILLLFITAIILFVTAMNYTEIDNIQLSDNAKNIMFIINLLLILFIIFCFFRIEFIWMAAIIIVGVSIINYILMSRSNNEWLAVLNLVLVFIFIGLYFHGVSKMI